ncbi:hypothetical protein HGRIS_010399 [Hohenbuehelia grisea]|uniref:Uncharacterized protein n=1 Tax=Hohenbuehelia grisea TaxID=104357 RepID=A0ABR3J477_9AGAR
MPPGIDILPSIPRNELETQDLTSDMGVRYTSPRAGELYFLLRRPRHCGTATISEDAYQALIKFAYGMLNVTLPAVIEYFRRQRGFTEDLVSSSPSAQFQYDGLHLDLSRQAHIRCPGLILCLL